MKIRLMESARVMQGAGVGNLNEMLLRWVGAEASGHYF